MRCLSRILVIGSAFLSWILFPVHLVAQEGLKADERLNCLLNAVDIRDCYQADEAFSLPQMRDSQNTRKSLVQKIKELSKFRYDLGSGFTFGTQRYVKNFGVRGKTFGFGKQLESSKLTINLHKPGLNWMTEVQKDVELNVRIGNGGEYGDKAQLIFGFGSSW